MLAVGLDFGKQSRSQLRLPLAQPQGFVTSGHNASDATARQSSRANISDSAPTQEPALRPYLLCTGSTPSRRRRRLPCNARTLANSYSFSAPTTSRSATTSSQDTCSVNAKLLNLWNFERHRSHATRDRKRTAHVSTNNIERVSHRIRRLLSARMCKLLNVCLRRLSIGSESHLTVA